ncbi:aminotransferase [Quadrisphaera sp. INWT6]|uniref:aminotransferase n=1 Tax=Quadrisphaera sp. INWT6 TaxID=2596917 RepID=UPI0018927C89|nr:aminotransferase [Quadrisphaera sp. INWT6]MBF5081276.1 aminotransferase [Quadrisphaera sp. INWT6]
MPVPAAATSTSWPVELPPLHLDEAWARAVVRQHFGLDAEARSLGSQQDANFLLTGASGDVVAVLKATHPATIAAEVEAHDEAADRIAERCPDLRVATVLRDAAGAPQRRLVDSPDGPLTARLLRYLPGGTAVDDGYLHPSRVARMGELAARVDLALAGWSHPGVGGASEWDPRHGLAAVEAHAPWLPEHRRAEVLAAARAAAERVAPLVGLLPEQVVHLDLTDDNLVLSEGGPRAAAVLDGVIDLSDVTCTWAVCELAVTLSSLLHHDGALHSGPSAVLPAVRAHHAVRPLAPAEVDALWPLVVLRACVLVACGSHQVAVDGGNDYASSRLEQNEWRIFEQAVALPVDVVAGLLRAALGTPPALPDEAARRLGAAATSTELVADLSGAAQLDLGWDADDLDGGAFLRPRVVEELAAVRLDAGARAVVTRWAQARLAGSPALSSAVPATVATGVEVRPGLPVVLRAPWDGAVRHRDGRLELTGRDARLVLDLDRCERAPLADDGPVGAGRALAEVSEGDVLGVQLLTAGAPDVPALVRAGDAPGWLALAADPSPLLGLPAAAPPHDGPGGAHDEAELLARRDAGVLAEVQEHYYTGAVRPPRVERGWRHHLATTDGRVLLDVVNNVTAVGHAHPRVAAAAARQLARLNTNSRFHYAGVVELSERIAALLPDPLDTVFLVNSGSEATDLAIRLAHVATGRTDTVAVREAYHGWTWASDAVSTSVADNPAALETRPAWVHTVEAPNTYRGPHRAARGDDVGQYARDAVAAVEELAARGRPPAAFIAEAFYGNAGGLPLPPGYLREVYAAVRRHGGLTIADEVQVGYGRLGSTLWGFEQQGVVPDVVAVAKSVGNGHPVGAVVTTRAVAARYRDAGYFFASTGGSPVSCAVALAVLDVLRDERLQENARETGARLRAGLESLAQRHPLVGAVHGEGLYLGLELVRDRATLEPAREETAVLCDRMLELGVVVQPTSDRQNVLKIKPPLCLDAAAVDFFVGALDRALGEVTTPTG